MPPAGSSGRKGKAATPQQAKKKGSSSSGGSATRLLASSSVLAALLAAGLPFGWRWWQQFSSLNDRHAVLEVAPGLQFAKRYRLGGSTGGFDLAWANGSISLWPAGVDDRRNALWCVGARSTQLIHRD